MDYQGFRENSARSCVSTAVVSGFCNGDEKVLCCSARVPEEYGKVGLNQCLFVLQKNARSVDYAVGFHA